MTHLESRRLILRPWLEADRLPFAAMNTDPKVMRYFPNVLIKSQSDAQFDRLQGELVGRGWGFWAAEIASTKQFIGFVGLSEPNLELPCSPCVEIGWRLANEFWGQGFATEAAQEALKFAFDTLGLEEIVSFTAALNYPSVAVMQRIGMIDSGKNFMHPSLPVGHELAEHVLYRLNQSDWRALGKVG